MDADRLFHAETPSKSPSSIAMLFDGVSVIVLTTRTGNQSLPVSLESHKLVSEFYSQDKYASSGVNLGPETSSGGNVATSAGSCSAC